MDDDALVVLKSYPSTMVKLIDISMDGLSFRYIHNLERLDRTTVLDIFQSNTGFYLGRAAFDTVSSEKISDFVRRLSVQFKGLSRQQKARLENFIEDCAIDGV